MKKYLFILLFSPIITYSQLSIGYIAGVTKIGINNPPHYQPMYGIVANQYFTKNINLETDFTYTQIQNYAHIQEDQLNFSLLGKLGWFGDKYGVYYGYGFALNPSLSHANPENHTYGSLLQAIGIQINVVPTIVLDFRGLYDIGLSGGYYKAGQFTKYSGLKFTTGIRFDLPPFKKKQ